VSGSNKTGGRGAYVTYLLALLLLINILNFVDRQILFILAQSIKHDLHLSDTQIGLMGGLAFAVVYSVLGLPLGRLADRYGAKWVLVGSLSVWSVLTTCGAFAQNFLQLAATRIGVAAGEAGSTPSGHAIIANYFPPEKRGLPLAVFSLGVPLGIMIGLMMGGWLNQVMGWREALIVAGIPGLTLALLFAFTVRMPAGGGGAGMKEDIALLRSLKLLWSKPTFRQMAYGISYYSMGANAMIVFTPSFLMRTYGLSSAGAGMSLGLVYGVAGVAGALIGGMAGDFLGRRDPRWRMWTVGIGLAAVMPFTLAAWMEPTPTASVLLLAAPKFANLIYFGPVFVALQMISPAGVRATASAFLLFFNSLVGQTVGPFVAGYVSDFLEPSMGNQSLRYALCFVVLTQFMAALHFFLAARTLKADTIN
jgi:MFS family permease